MPEGHVIHRLATGMTTRFAGRSVRVASPQGRFADAAALLDGSVLVDAQAVGKHLLVGFEDDHVVWIHLGLIGRLAFVPAGTPSNPSTLRLRVSADGQAADLRGPQWCRLITGPESDAVVAASGPDPLRDDADPSRAWAKLSRTSRPVGAVLMDQSVFAGVGNIFRAETLFRHGIDPHVAARQVPRAVFDSVWADLVGLMRYAYRVGRIDTVDEDHTPQAMGRPPREDPHGGEVYVYRRAGMPCLVCGTEVRTEVMAGRNLYWCPSCQPSGATGVSLATPSV
ncbi:Fpg/Nei family DNA glycosylase [Brooklawnia cerclae]|uniref:DNA-(apurinic or apyrimidinic site) lyase n=1 Tax=Brooklawnia cerclae TaxID=349934 RepID=A0ABX0SN97_9ACTN|nr:endonuclease-8/formamidopyrimidine-DNA glycosylase [Brooklawnia cerclae]